MSGIGGYERARRIRACALAGNKRVSPKTAFKNGGNIQIAQMCSQKVHGTRHTLEEGLIDRHLLLHTGTLTLRL